MKTLNPIDHRGSIPIIREDHNHISYDVTLADPDKWERKFDCAHCDKVIRRPVRIKECGHHCCESCLQIILRIEARCPRDHLRFNKDQVLEDKELEQELMFVEVKCVNYKNRCPWRGPYKELQNHIPECAFRLLSCPENCGAQFEKYFLLRHLRNDCPNKIVTCEFCTENFTSNERENHIKTCTKYKVKCPEGCKAMIAADQVEAHLEKKCPRHDIVCPYVDAGCKFKAERQYMKGHMKADIDDHTQLVTQAISGALAFMNGHQENDQLWLQTMNKRLDKINSRMGGLIKQYESHLIWKIEQFHDKFVEAKLASENGSPVNFSSPYIAVTRYGYRLKMIAYLYGFGSAAAVFMSLYVCLCPTDHDKLIPWPFHSVIELTLLDQCPQKDKRHDVTFRIDTSKQEQELVVRPSEKQNNPSFGTDRFIRIDTLRIADHYIIGDAIFLRINFLPVEQQEQKEQQS